MLLLGFAVSLPAADPSLWASQAALVAASVADAHSSFGGRELNPLLRGPEGEFGARGAAIKGAAVAVLLVTEYLVSRKHPRARRVLNRLNWIMAGGTAAIAARNYYVTR